LKRNAATFYLTSGKLFLTSPLQGYVRGAVFYGEGKVTLTTNNKMDQDQLERYTQKRSFSENIETVFFMFTDSTYEELRSKLTFKPDSDTKEANGIAEESLLYLYNESTKIINPDLFKSIIENRNDGFFHSQFRTTENELFSFQINPYQEEEILFHKGYSYINHKLYDTIIRTESSDDRLNRQIKNDQFIRTDKYSIEVKIDRNKNFSATSTLTFQSRIKEQEWLPFNLYDDLEIDSVKFAGSNIQFFKEDSSPILWINFPHPLGKWHKYDLAFYYHGDLFTYNTKGWIKIKSSGRWFPKYGTRNYAEYDMTFKYPSELTLVAVGTNTEEREEDGYKIARWESKMKIRNASFNIGSFKEYTVKEEGIPEVKVYHSKYGHRGSLANAEVVVGKDIKSSLRFFTEKFGKLDSKLIRASEIPFYHGEAFPGFIHLSFTTFQNTDYYGIDQIFRAHEVAHQWWAIDLDFETYHDQWLSEAFAEYSGLLYLEEQSGLEKVLAYLNDYKDKILYNRKYLLGDGQEAGPIYMGYTTSGRNTRGDYDLIIYKKGAWVLHMLKMMMIDLHTLDDTPFTYLLKDFFISFQGGMANTNDFLKIVEKHFNNDMRWFFDQWIYGTYIPEIEFTHKTVWNDDHYTVKFKTKITDTPPNYKAYPIIRVIDEKNKTMRFRVPINDGKTEFELQIGSDAPNEIEFNVLNSLLCEQDNVDWEDID